jgi:hypothetical protein
VLNSARQAGGAVGVAILGTLLAGRAFVTGLHAAMAVSAGAFLFAAIVTAGWSSGPAAPSPGGHRLRTRHHECI